MIIFGLGDGPIYSVRITQSQKQLCKDSNTNAKPGPNCGVDCIDGCTSMPQVAIRIVRSILLLGEIVHRLGDRGTT